MKISDRRIPELDGLRGIAILLVLAWHFTGMLVDPSQGRIQYAFWRFAIFGQSGVDLFFLLSGFLIIGILIDNRESPSYFATFYLRRALRILPPYLILVALFALCTLVFGPTVYLGHELPLWSLLTFTQNWVMASIPGYGPAGVAATWSLAIEEQFYLCAPALIFFLPKRFLPQTLIVICICSILARSSWFYFHNENLYAPDVATPLRLDGLCLGGLIAFAFRRPLLWKSILEKRKLFFRSMLILASVIPFYTWLSRSSIAHDVLYYFGHTYLAIFYGLVLLNAIIWSASSATAFLRGTHLTDVGLISYSLYLFHTPMKGIYFLLAGHTETLQSPLDALLLVAALASTFAFCTVLYRFVELPAQNLGRQFRYTSGPEVKSLHTTPFVEQAQ